MLKLLCICICLVDLVYCKVYISKCDKTCTGNQIGYVDENDMWKLTPIKGEEEDPSLCNCGFASNESFGKIVDRLSTELAELRFQLSLMNPNYASNTVGNHATTTSTSSFAADDEEEFSSPNQFTARIFQSMNTIAPTTPVAVDHNVEIIPELVDIQGVQDEIESWIELDALKNVRFAGVIVQGGVGLRKVLSYVTHFKVAIRKSGVAASFDNIIRKENGDDKIFVGNNDGTSPVQRYFDHRIEGRHIRIYPYAFVNRPLLRFEVIFC